MSIKIFLNAYFTEVNGLMMESFYPYLRKFFKWMWVIVLVLLGFTFFKIHRFEPGSVLNDIGLVFNYYALLFVITLGLVFALFSVILFIAPAGRAWYVLRHSTNQESQTLPQAVTPLTITDSDSQIQSNIHIHEEDLKKLFAPEWDGFSSFVHTLEEKTQNYCKRDYGKLLVLLLKHCSSFNKQLYIRRYNFNPEPVFEDYCTHFYRSIGIKPSSTDKGYYEGGPTNHLKSDFEDFLK